MSARSARKSWDSGHRGEVYRTIVTIMGQAANAGLSWDDSIARLGAWMTAQLDAAPQERSLYKAAWREYLTRREAYRAPTFSTIIST